MKLRAATGAPILLNQNDYDLLKMLDIQATWIGVAPPGKVEMDQSIGQADTVTAGSLAWQMCFSLQAIPKEASAFISPSRRN